MTGEILFLAHRIPFPPDRGDKIRSHHLLKALAKLAPVHVGCFGESQTDLAQAPAVTALATSHHLARRPGNLASAGMRALARGRPISLSAFDDDGLREWVRATLSAHPIDTIFIFSGQMGQYVPRDFCGKVVIDLCDVDSAKFEAYAADGKPPRSWVDAREGRLLAAEEAQLAARADCTLFISEAEADLFRSRCARSRRIEILRNGIDAAQFDPRRIEPHPELSGAPGPHIVFTGQMDYAPNVAAALRVIRSILPAVRQVHREAQFHVVGRAPTRALLRHGDDPGVRIWGEVPDVRPFLAAADLVLAPLEVARGVQNKVLEAMAMARPVLLTPGAATGIGAKDGVHLTVASSDADLAARACDLLFDGPRALALGASARRFVLDNLAWEAVLSPLARVVGREPRAQARDAA